LATLEEYFSCFCQHSVQDQSLVSGFIIFAFALTPKPQLQRPLKSYQSTALLSIQHYDNFPPAVDLSNVAKKTLNCHFLVHISNDPNFRLKHPGVPDCSDGSDGTSYAVTENYTLPVALAMGRVAYVPPLLYGDVYTSSERHMCYTLRRGCSYAEAVYTTPGNRRQGWEHLGAPATCLGAPRITVMDSVCILIYVSMYLCIYIATHLHTRYLDWLRSAEYILPFTLSTSVTPLIERV